MPRSRWNCAVPVGGKKGTLSAPPQSWTCVRLKGRTPCVGFEAVSWWWRTPQWWKGRRESVAGRCDRCRRRSVESCSAEGRPLWWKRTLDWSSGVMTRCHMICLRHACAPAPSDARLATAPTLGCVSSRTNAMDEGNCMSCPAVVATNT